MDVAAEWWCGRGTKRLRARLGNVESAVGCTVRLKVDMEGCWIGLFLKTDSKLDLGTITLKFLITLIFFSQNVLSIFQ